MAVIAILDEQRRPALVPGPMIKGLEEIVQRDSLSEIAVCVARDLVPPMGGDVKHLPRMNSTVESTRATQVRKQFIIRSSDVYWAVHMGFRLDGGYVRRVSGEHGTSIRRE